MATQTARPVPAAPFRAARTVELRFGGVEEAGPSFEGRVFLNNPAAEERSPLTPEAGYAGSFYVYGYGEPLPPAVADAKRRAPDGAVIVPIDMQLALDPAAVRAAVADADELTVTVVPVPVDPGGPLPERAFERVEAVFDRAGRE
jgi:hypothetical protein